MKINKIQKKNNKYKILLEDSTVIETYDEVIIKENILYKKEITEELRNKIKKENKYYETYNKLLKNKIDEALIEEEIEKIDKEKILEKLKRLILKKINTNTKYSNNMLKQKLVNYFMNLGYEKSDIVDIKENNQKQNNEIIKKEYNKIYNKLKNKYDEEELKRNIRQKLYQKGFSIDEINNIN